MARSEPRCFLVYVTRHEPRRSYSRGRHRIMLMINWICIRANWCRVTVNGARGALIQPGSGPTSLVKRNSYPTDGLWTPLKVDHVRWWEWESLSSVCLRGESASREFRVNGIKTERGLRGIWGRECAFGNWILEQPVEWLQKWKSVFFPCKIFAWVDNLKFFQFLYPRRT